MSQEYSDPKRECNPFALPDLEVFYIHPADIAAEAWKDEEGNDYAPGFYWWACFPGCLPDSEPVGPFATYNEALDDARSNNEDPDDSE